jgi:hypothetical protein
MSKWTRRAGTAFYVRHLTVKQRYHVYNVLCDYLDITDPHYFTAKVITTADWFVAYFGEDRMHMPLTNVPKDGPTFKDHLKICILPEVEDEFEEDSIEF